MKKNISGLVLSIIAMTFIVMPFGVFADTYGTNTNQTATSTTSTIQQPDLVCVQKAITKRDSAIVAAVDAFNAALKSALQTRTTALVSAWSLTDRTARRKAIRAAWTTYTKAARDARRAFNAAKKSAWTQFKTDGKACGKATARVLSDDNGALGSDVNL